MTVLDQVTIFFSIASILDWCAFLGLLYFWWKTFTVFADTQSNVITIYHNSLFVIKRLKVELSEIDIGPEMSEPLGTAHKWRHQIFLQHFDPSLPTLLVFYSYVSLMFPWFFCCVENSVNFFVKVWTKGTFWKPI